MATEANEFVNGTLELTVKSIGKWGPLDIDGNFWSIGGKCKLTKDQFIPGIRYIVDWYQKVGTKTKYIRAASPVKTNDAPVPSLPQTSVVNTPAPGGEKPVSSARVPAEQKPDQRYWDNRNESIERQAVLKSVLEAPLLAKLSDDVDGAKVLITELFNHSYRLLKGE